MASAAARTHWPPGGRYRVLQSRITFPDFPDPMVSNPCRNSCTGK